MSFLKVVVFGYPFFKFQGSKKLLGDTTLSRAGFSTKMKSAFFGRNRAWIHTSQKFLSLSNWWSTPDNRLLRNLYCNFSRWWQLKYVFISTPITWGFMLQFDFRMFFRMQKCDGFLSHLQAAVVLQSAWRRRAAQVRDMPCPSFFSSKCVVRWMDGSHCRSRTKKENGTSDWLVCSLF